MTINLMHRVMYRKGEEGLIVFIAAQIWREKEKGRYSFKICSYP